jgi:hypothetical protein
MNAFDALAELEPGVLLATRRFDDPVRDAAVRSDSDVAKRPNYVDLSLPPTGFQFEEGENLNYDPYVDSPMGKSDLVHHEYRGIDNERFGKLNFRNPKPAMIIFDDRLQSDGTATDIGYLPEPGASVEEKNKALVRVSYSTSTQFAGVCLHIPRPGNKDINYRIFGNSLMLRQKGEDRLVGHRTIHYGPHNQEAVHGSLGGHEILTPLARANDLIATKCALWANDGQHLRPSFTGISEAEIQCLVSLYNNELTRTHLLPWELLVVQLYETRLLTIFRRLGTVPMEDNEVLETESFVDYINSVIWLNAMHGALWFYKLQSPLTPLMSKEYPLEDVAVPRWLVNLWRATKNEAEEIIKCEPREWSSFPQTLDYPDEQCCAFMAALGVIREAEHTRASIKELISSKDGALKAIFRQSKARPGQFLVEVFAPSELTSVSVWRNLKPAVDTRLSISIVDPRFVLKFHGRITDDIFGKEGSNCDFIAGVTGRAMDLPECELPIEIELKDDPTTANRAVDAIRCLSQGVTRDSGVDICRDLFGAPPTVPLEKLNALPNLLASDALTAALNRLDKDYSLNVDQANAAKACITEAYTLVWGPAGTGKTKTCAAAVNEIASLGVKQVFACTTNRAVDKVLSCCLGINPSLKAVRFVGGFRSTKSTSDSNTTTGIGDGTVSDEEEHFEMYLDQLDIKEATHSKHLFQVRKLEAVKDFASDDRHPQCENAKHYLLLREELFEAKGKFRKAIQMQLDDVDKPLHDYFLEHCVDAVFVTCSSACHEALQNYKAQVITVDEAGQATKSDMCMTTAPFKESLLSLNMFGDYVQLGPVATSSKQNEALYTLNKSHFETHIKDDSDQWPHHVLRDHYRSHPDITAFPNEVLYESQLRSAKSTMELNGLHKTLQQFFDPLGPAWNKKWRMGIDVRGESELYGNSTSVCNDAEANMIVNLILKMTTFEPVDDAVLPKPEKVRLSDIGVVTVYKGQVRTIWHKLKVAGIDPKGLAFLVTTARVQGDDAPICICSGVAAHKTDVNKGLKFTAEAKAIVVNTTRSRYLDIYVANFGPAVTYLYTKKRGEPSVLSSKQARMYRKLVEHLHENDSIISAGDILRALISDTPQRLQQSSYRQTHNYGLEKLS